MSTRSASTPRPGDRIKVRFGRRVVDGIVTSVRGDQVHVDLDIEGTTEPVAGLYNEKQLISA